MLAPIVKRFASNDCDGPGVNRDLSVRARRRSCSCVSTSRLPTFAKSAFIASSRILSRASKITRALRVIRDQAIRDERAFASAVENCPEAKLEEISRIITCVSSKGSRMSFARMLRTEGRG
jgi:hypothetical protein